VSRLNYLFILLLNKFFDLLIAINNNNNNNATITVNADEFSSC